MLVYAPEGGWGDEPSAGLVTRATSARLAFRGFRRAQEERSPFPALAIRKPSRRWVSSAGKVLRDQKKIRQRRFPRLSFQRKDAKARSRKERLSQSVGHPVDAVLDQAHAEIHDQCQLEVHEAEVGEGLRLEHRVVGDRRFALDEDSVL
jgi:hypothetical protein